MRRSGYIVAVAALLVLAWLTLLFNEWRLDGDYYSLSWLLASGLVLSSFVPLALVHDQGVFCSISGTLSHL